MIFRVRSVLSIFQLLSLAVLVVQVQTADSVTIQWTGTPVNIDIEVDAERRITVPSATNIRVGIPSDVNRLLKVQVIGNSLWLTAQEPFDYRRMVVITETLGRIVLSIRAVTLDIPETAVVIEPKPDTVAGQSVNTLPSYSFVELTRWAIQQLYSPKRLLNELPGVVQVSVDDELFDLFRCGRRRPSICSGGINAWAIAGWQSLHHYVTAVQIRNNLTESVTLDPREIRGSWRTAAFVHPKLQAKDKPNDTTVAILISDFPFQIPQL